jgi:gliding motility-associated-like protein
VKKVCLFALTLLACLCGFAQTTITLQPSAVAGKDAMLDSYYPTTNFGTTSESNTLAWTISSNPFVLRSLIQFDLTSIPTCVYIQAAVLYLYNNPNSQHAFLNGEHSHLSGTNQSWVRRVTSPWTESTVTWNTQPTSTTSAQAMIPEDVMPNEDYSISVTNIVQDMVDFPALSHGFMLQLDTEQIYRALLFASSDHPNAALHPKLVVTYQDKTQAAFTPTVVPCNASVSFLNSSTFATAYVWNFGDGGSDTAMHPTYVYATSGTYNVQLIANPNTACADTTYRVVNIIAPGTAQFTTTSQCNLTVQFNNQSVNGTAYHWDFGNGDTSNAINPLYTYPAAGNYSVQLIANPGTPCADTITHNVVANTQGTAAFSPTTACSLNVQFQNQSLNTQAYFWNFGDGNTDTSANPSHLYNAVGTYNVMLISNPNTSCADTLYQSLDVIAAGAAQFTSQSGCNLSVSFFNQSTNAFNSFWDFGDGDSSLSSNPQHTFATAGIYDVYLTINRGTPCATTILQHVSVTPQGTAIVSPIITPCDLNVQFQNQSTNVTTYYWNFGDGNTDTTANPSHLYAVPGTYFVHLFVNANTLCPDTFNQAVTVSLTPGVASYTSSVQHCDFTAQFSNSSQLAYTYDWDFGDFITDTTANPSHVYASNGTYAVTLIVNGGTMCADTVRDSVRISVIPGIASFNHEQEFCDPNVNFLNQSIDAFSYQWDLGDEQTSTKLHPTHVYAYEGDYYVTLYINRNTLCADSVKKKVHASILDDSGLFIPNSFTPNGDGQNDLFRVFSICAEYQLSIFNRWGEKVYETDDADAHPWDGTLRGNPVQEGVYCYLLKGNDKHRTGSVMLYR